MTSGQARARSRIWCVEGPEDAPAPVVGVDVDALEPPDPAGPPVAPLAGDRRLADDPGDGWVLGVVGNLGDPVAEPAGLGEGGPDAPGKDLAVEGLALGLVGESGVELDDDVEVVGPGLPGRGGGRGHQIRSLRRFLARRLASSRIRLSSSFSEPRPSLAILIRTSSSFSSKSSSGITAIGAGRVAAAVLGDQVGPIEGRLDGEDDDEEDGSRGSGETIRSLGRLRNIFSRRDRRRSPTLKR